MKQGNRTPFADLLLRHPDNSLAAANGFAYGLKTETRQFSTNFFSEEENPPEKIHPK